MPNNWLVPPPAVGALLGNPGSATVIVTDILSKVGRTKHLKHFFPWPVEFRDGVAGFRRYTFYWWVSHGS